MKRMVLTVGAVLAGVTAANASGYGDSIDRRQHNQERRIESGRRDGLLARREYFRLEAEQSRIRTMEARRHHSLRAWFVFLERLGGAPPSARARREIVLGLGG